MRNIEFYDKATYGPLEQDLFLVATRSSVWIKSYHVFAKKSKYCQKKSNPNASSNLLEAHPELTRDKVFEIFLEQQKMEKEAYARASRL